MNRPAIVRKKPRDILAIRWTGQNVSAVLAFTGVQGRVSLDGQSIVVGTANGGVEARIGDWIAKQIIRGHEDIWPIASDVFDDSYFIWQFLDD